MLKEFFSTIPNMEYHMHDKFVYGVVLSINNVDYYVPFSYYSKQQEDNILITFDFSAFEEERKILLRKEYKSCLSSAFKNSKNSH